MHTVRVRPGGWCEGHRVTEATGSLVGSWRQEPFEGLVGGYEPEAWWLVDTGADEKLVNQFKSNVFI